MEYRLSPEALELLRRRLGFPPIQPSSAKEEMLRRREEMLRERMAPGVGYRHAPVDPEMEKRLKRLYRGLLDDPK